MIEYLIEQHRDNENLQKWNDIIIWNRKRWSFILLKRVYTLNQVVYIVMAPW